MKKIVLFLFFAALAASSLIAQQYVELSTAEEYHEALKKEAPSFTSDIIDLNPEPADFTSKANALFLLAGKGELLWNRYKSENELSDLINSYKSFNRGVKVMEYMVQNNLSKSDKQLIDDVNIKLYESTIKTAMEGLNVANTVAMQDRSFYYMQSNKMLFDLKLPARASTTSQDAFREAMPKIEDCQSYLTLSNQALIEYFVGDELIYGFVIWKDGSKIFSIGNKDQVLKNITQLNKNIVGSGDQKYADFTSAARYLFQAIFKHPLSLLPPETNNIIVVPHRQFDQIPFDLLLTADAPAGQTSFLNTNLDYALKKYGITYASSVYQLLKENASDAANSYPDAASIQKPKLALTGNSKKPYPQDWASLWPNNALGTALNAGEDSSNNKMPYWPIALVAGLLLLFAGMKMFKK